MPEPVKLSCTAGGPLIGKRDWIDPPGAVVRQIYNMCDLPGGSRQTTDPITAAADALVDDGYPLGVNFALKTLKGEILFIGRIADHHSGLTRTG